MLFGVLNVNTGPGVNCDVNIHASDSVLPQEDHLVNLRSSPQVTVIYNQVVFGFPDRVSLCNPD